MKQHRISSEDMREMGMESDLTMATWTLLRPGELGLDGTDISIQMAIWDGHTDKTEPPFSLKWRGKVLDNHAREYATLVEAKKAAMRVAASDPKTLMWSLSYQDLADVDPHLAHERQAEKNAAQKKVMREIEGTV